ncbi:hypothetical protein G6011_10112 [Alternaria panax]|uniref:Uncharacterized protein n=1 Tax=Alternaria panax TaxID=48097 RepID=A0AAD4I8N3_9PLEO|nr:hypothetical protein G6011_10112 [Alternaria panax]
MGFFNVFVDMYEELGRKAEAALQYARQIAEEAQRKLREAIEEAEQVAKSLTEKVAATAKGVQQDLENLTPNFDKELKNIMDEVGEIAAAAAEEGVDITEAINSAVETALKKVEEALKAVVDAVDRFLWQAQDTLFGFLRGVLPDWLQWILDKVQQAVQSALQGLHSFADKLKKQISVMLEKIKSDIQAFVKRVGEVLGPIWKFVKALWKLLFGTEPEHCQMLAEWFAERMKRTENQLLYKHSTEPVSALIKRHTYLELLPPNEDAWKTVTHEFLNRGDSILAWSEHGARMMPLLASTKPKAGNVTQLTWDEPFTDALGGRQRVQISVLYFRWKTEEFRKVSSGFLGILAMICATGPQDGTNVLSPMVEPRRPRPLQMDPATTKRIYDEIAPYIRRNQLETYKACTNVTPFDKGQSRQLRVRGDDGIWKDVR